MKNVFTSQNSQNSPSVSYHHLPGNQKLLISQRLLCLKMLFLQQREGGGKETIKCKNLLVILGSNLPNHIFASLQKFEKAILK